MTCRGICKRHKARHIVGKSMYALGYRRCKACDIYLDWQGMWCPCCGMRLRTNSPDTKHCWRPANELREVAA